MMMMNYDDITVEMLEMCSYVGFIATTLLMCA